jgi:hypothetical protein
MQEGNVDNAGKGHFLPAGPKWEEGGEMGVLLGAWDLMSRPEGCSV